MTEHIVTLSIAVYDAATGQEACNKAYHMMRKDMSSMSFIVTDEDGTCEEHQPLVGPMFRVVRDDE